MHTITVTINFLDPGKKIVFSQIFYQYTFNLFDRFQSGFRALYSTESAVLIIYNDIFLSVHSCSCAILVLLSLSAAFDTIDHDILLLTGG